MTIEERIDRYLNEGKVKYEVSIEKGIKGQVMKEFADEDEAVKYAKSLVPKLKHLQAVTVEKVSSSSRKNIYSHQNEG